MTAINLRELLSQKRRVYAHKAHQRAHINNAKHPTYLYDHNLFDNYISVPCFCRNIICNFRCRFDVSASHDDAIIGPETGKCGSDTPPDTLGAASDEAQSPLIYTHGDFNFIYPVGVR